MTLTEELKDQFLLLSDTLGPDAAKQVMLAAWDRLPLRQQAALALQLRKEAKTKGRKP